MRPGDRPDRAAEPPARRLLARAVECGRARRESGRQHRPLGARVVTAGGQHPGRRLTAKGDDRQARTLAQPYQSTRVEQMQVARCVQRVPAGPVESESQTADVRGRDVDRAAGDTLPNPTALAITLIDTYVRFPSA